MSELRRATDNQLWDQLEQAQGREKVDVLYELANRAFERRDFQRSLTLLQQIQAEAFELGDRRLEAEVLHSRGVAAFNARQCALSAQSYQNAAEIFIEVQCPAQAALSLRNGAEALLELGNHPQCLAAAQDAARLADQDEEHRLSGEAYYLQATCYSALEDNTAALDACDSARQRFQRAGAADEVARTDDLAVFILMQTGDTEHSLRVARNAVTLAKADDGDEAGARLRLAEVRFRRGEHKLALKQVRRALQQFRAQGNSSAVASCVWLQARILVTDGQWAAGVDGFERASSLLDAVGRSADHLLCRAHLAMSLHDMGKFGRAARINRQLVRSWRSDEATIDEARAAATRLVDNLYADGKYRKIVNCVDGLRDLWPKDITADDPLYRDLLARWAYALDRLGRREYALAMANHVLNHTWPGTEDAALAACLEVRGRAQLGRDQDAAMLDLTGAISAYLAVGQSDRARRVSQYLLEARRPVAVDEAA